MADHNRTREEIANRLRALGGRGNVKPQSVLMTQGIDAGKTWRVELRPPRGFKNIRLYCSSASSVDISLDSVLVAGVEQLRVNDLPVLIFRDGMDIETGAADEGSRVELHFRNTGKTEGRLAFKATFGVHPKDR